MTENKKPVVVGIGEILWDMLPAGKQLGGAPANFAYFAKALGAEAYVASRVGADVLGREILNRLKKLGFNRKYVAVDRRHPTGVVEVRLDRSGKPSYAIKRNVAWDFILPRPELLSLARRTQAMCFGSLAQRGAVARATIRKFVAAVPPAALRVFDINLRQSFYDRKTIHELLQIANILKLNDDELRVVADMYALPAGETPAIKCLMRKYQLRVVALTMGPRGAVLYCPEGRYPAPAGKVRVIDTVGAGDAFTAALVMGLLNGLKMGTVSALANRLATYVCGQHGATPRLPSGMIPLIGARGLALPGGKRK